jgi:hypothetical protein
MPLTPVSETYLAGLNATCSLGGTTIGTVEDGSYKIEGMNDEMTNNGSSGVYEDVATIKKATGTIKVAFVGSSTPHIVVNTIYAMILDIGSGTGTEFPYYSGNVRINSKDTPLLDVHGGVHQTFSWTSQGGFSETKS